MQALLHFARVPARHRAALALLPGALALALCGTPAAAQTAEPSAYAELSPQARMDQLAVRLRAAIVAGDHGHTLALARDIRALGLPTGTEILFYEGQALLRTQQQGPARLALTDYVNQAGRDGANYAAALGLLDEIAQWQDDYRVRAAKAIDQAINSESYGRARRLLNEAAAQLPPGDEKLAALGRRLADEEAAVPQRRAQREQALAAREQDWQRCRANHEQLREVGAIDSVHAEWGFVVVRLDVEPELFPMSIRGSAGAIDASPGKLLPGKLVSAAVTLPPAALAQLRAGMRVSNKPVAAASSPCVKIEAEIRSLKNALERRS